MEKHIAEQKLDLSITDPFRLEIKNKLLFFMPSILVVVSALIAFFIFSKTLINANQSHVNQIAQLSMRHVEDHINGVLSRHKEVLNSVVSHPRVFLAFEKDEAYREALQTQLMDNFPNALMVRLFPIRSASVQLDQFPPLNFSSLDMIRRVEQGQKLIIETHNVNDIHYLNSVKAIYNDTGELVGTILVSQSIDFLINHTAIAEEGHGYLEVSQHIGPDKFRTFLQLGAKAEYDVVVLTRVNPNWRIVFQLPSEVYETSLINLNYFWLLWLVIFLVVMSSNLVSFFALHKALTQDVIQIIYHFYDSASSNKKSQKKKKYHSEIFYTLEQNFQRILEFMNANRFNSNNYSDMIKDEDSLFMKEFSFQDDVDVPISQADSELLGMPSVLGRSNQDNDISNDVFQSEGIVGFYSQNLTSDMAIQIGMAIGSEAELQKVKKIVVGRDGRLSSPMLLQAIIRGLMSTGRDVVNLGMVPISALHYSCEKLQLSSFVMVSAHHFNQDCNGLTVVLNHQPILNDHIQKLHRRIIEADFIKGQGQTQSINFEKFYLFALHKKLKVERPLKVVLDCGNGIAGLMLPKLLKQLGCHVLPLFSDVDGNFPNHYPDPNDVGLLQVLTRTVVETRADVGFAFDGSASRFSVISEKGNRISSDQLLMLFAREILKEHPGASIVHDVHFSYILDRFIHELGGESILSKAHPLSLRQKMMESNALLAASYDGYLLFNDNWYGFEDALYAVGRVLELISEQSTVVSSLIEPLPVIPFSVEVKVSLGQVTRESFLTQLLTIPWPNANRVIHIDGIRVEFDHGWFCIHSMQAMESLACRIEAQSEEVLNAIKGALHEKLLELDHELQLLY